MQHHWEKIAENMQRLYVPGGWLVFRWEVVTLAKVGLGDPTRVIFKPMASEQIPFAVGGLTFLPDPHHIWGSQPIEEEQDEPEQKKAA